MAQEEINFHHEDGCLSHYPQPALHDEKSSVQGKKVKNATEIPAYSKVNVFQYPAWAYPVSPQRSPA